MAKRTYEFEILARIEKALLSVEELQKKSQKDLDSINFNTAVSAISDGFHLIRDAGTSAFKAITAVLGESIAAANEQEDADIRLANSLRLMGDLSETSLASFDRLADSIAATTKFTDSQVKSSIALSKQYRLTNAEAEKVARVSADLAATFGITLDDATRQVSQTFNGFVDKGLAKVIPGLKDMGLAALVGGGALEKIGKQVHGTAEVLGNTFSGALGRAQESLNKIFETIGDVIIKNPALIIGLNKIQEGFKALNDQLKLSSGSLRNIVTDGFLLVIQAAAPFLEAIQRILNNMRFVKLIIDEVGASLGAFAAVLANPFQAGDIFEALKEDLGDLETKFGEALNASEDFFAPLIKRTKDIVASTTKAVEAARNLKPAFQGVGKDVGNSLTGVSARIAELSEQFKTQIENLSKDPIKAGFDLFIRKKIDLRKEDAIALGVGLVNSVVKGAAGAAKAISGVIGGIADLLLPGIGSVVSEIVDVLALGPDKVREMVTSFARAIPGIIDNIAKSLPVLIEALVTELPPALAKAMPTVAVGFSTALIANMPNIVKGFASGLVEAAKQFVQAIIDQVKSVGGLLGGGDSGGALGGVGDFLGNIGSGIGDFFNSLNPFATGGRIPDISSFRGDGAVIRADAGEQIFSRDLTGRLEKFLDGAQSTPAPVAMPDVVVNIGLQQFARLMFDAKKAGYPL